MQKTLVAVAVAGALGVPTVAQAQNATVNIYGRFYMEYSKVFKGNQNAVNGQPTVDVDMVQNPGSRIGFRGEEKLGGGMSAWFQCETSADFRGVNQEGWCARNSALGLKGGFGNVFVGVWDTPFKRVIDQTGANDTGVFGAANVLFGYSTTVNSGAASQGLFKRRQRNSVNYDTPTFAGFKVMGAFTTLNSQTNTVNSATGAKPRVYSIGTEYNNGPINVYAAYQKHKDVTGATGAGDDKGWVVGANYTFAKTLKVGGLYSQQKFQTSGTTEGKVNVWHLGIDWMFSGPHGVRAAYSTAGDIKGNSTAIGTLRPAAGGDTGVQLWQIRYVHKLSKRTELTAGYVKIKNERNANYPIIGTGFNQRGNDPSAIAIGLDHRF